MSFFLSLLLYHSFITIVASTSLYIPVTGWLIYSCVFIFGCPNNACILWFYFTRCDLLRALHYFLLSVFILCLNSFSYVILNRIIDNHFTFFNLLMLNQYFACVLLNLLYYLLLCCDFVTPKQVHSIK